MFDHCRHLFCGRIGCEMATKIIIYEIDKGRGEKIFVGTNLVINALNDLIYDFFS